MNKTFYQLTRLHPKGVPTGRCKRFDTEKEALEKAKEVAEGIQGQEFATVHVMKCIAIVGAKKPPIKVTRFK